MGRTHRQRQLDVDRLHPLRHDLTDGGDSNNGTASYATERWHPDDAGPAWERRQWRVPPTARLKYPRSAAPSTAPRAAAACHRRHGLLGAAELRDPDGPRQLYRPGMATAMDKAPRAASRLIGSTSMAPRSQAAPIMTASSSVPLTGGAPTVLGPTSTGPTERTLRQPHRHRPHPLWHHGRRRRL